jgi:hypothetical protein
MIGTREFVSEPHFSLRIPNTWEISSSSGTVVLSNPSAPASLRIGILDLGPSFGLIPDEALVRAVAKLTPNVLSMDPKHREQRTEVISAGNVRIAYVEYAGESERRTFAVAHRKRYVLQITYRGADCAKESVSHDLWTMLKSLQVDLDN